MPLGQSLTHGGLLQRCFRALLIKPEALQHLLWLQAEACGNGGKNGSCLWLIHEQREDDLCEHSGWLAELMGLGCCMRGLVC